MKTITQFITMTIVISFIAQINAFPVQSQCTMPKEEVLRKKFANMYALNIDPIIDGVVYLKTAQQKYEHSIVNINITKNHSYKTEGDKECSRTQKNIFHNESHKSVCDHHFAIVQRDDLYPFTRHHAVCNCETCLNLESIGSIGCMPVYTMLYALKRGACLDNNEYEWKPVLENVAISCSCSQFTTYSS